MIQVMIVEDNIYKVQKLIDQRYLEWTNKTWAVTAHESEFERLLRLQDTPLECLYLDYELAPGAGNGLSILRNIPECKVRKVVCISFSKEAAREMQTICKDRNIQFEYLRL